MTVDRTKKVQMLKERAEEFSARTLDSDVVLTQRERDEMASLKFEMALNSLIMLSEVLGRSEKGI